MSFDAHKNFAVSTVATAPSPASSGTSLVVAAATGTLFPAVPFNAVIWPTASNPTTTNAEVVRVTAISTDTFTITRAQESSSARTVVIGDQIMAGLTAKTIKDIEDFLNGGSLTAHGVLLGNGTSAIVATAAGTTGDHLRSGGASADPSFVAINTLQASPSLPASIQSASYLCFGLAQSFTPTSSGKLFVTITFTTKLGVNTVSQFFQLRYGTGSAPTNGAADTGTLFGAGVGQQSSSTLFSETVLIGILTGLTPNTTYWIDVVGKSATGAISFLTSSFVDVSVFEL